MVSLVAKKKGHQLYYYVVESARVHRGNVTDGEEFSTSLARMLGMLDRCRIARDTVTLVLDKGSAALANTVELQEAGVGWISALPWNQAPAAFRERAVEQLPLDRKSTRLNSSHPSISYAVFCL